MTGTCQDDSFIALGCPFFSCLKVWLPEDVMDT
jgi:hypothetical protein